MKQPTVYIMTNRTSSVLYVGVTGNLKRRIWLHKTGEIDGFTKKYNVQKLVYFEVFEDFRAAIEREKQLKKWNRPWKDNLINKLNPSRCDLYDELL